MKMEFAEKFLRKTNSRMAVNERLSSHSIPRVNLHRDALKSRWEDFLEDPSSIEGYSNFTASLPLPLVPVGVVNRAAANGFDPVQRVVHLKKKHKQKLCRAAHSTKVEQSEGANISSLLLSEEPGVHIDSRLYSLALLASEDPDPHMGVDYNSYYSNTAALFYFNGRTMVIYPDPNSLDKLNFLFPKITEDLCLTDEFQQARHFMNGDEVIYDVGISSNVLLLRQKTTCGLFVLEGEQVCQLRKLASVSAQNVYLSSCLNDFSRSKFAVLSPGFLLDIHDVDGGSSFRHTVDVEEPVDDWGHVHYHDPNTFLFADRRSVRLLDLRKPGSAIKWDVLPVAEMCDEVYSAAKGSTLHYVNTKHYLLSLDVRAGWHQRWAHCLLSSPSLLSVVQRQNVSDTLLLGSQQDGGVVCLNNLNTTNFDLEFAKSPPFRLPSPTETLHAARAAGRCLSPLVSSRFCMSLVGLAAYKTFEEVQLFTLSSLGDVFSQTLTPRENSEPPTYPLVEQELNHLDTWAATCAQTYNELRTPLSATQMMPCQHYVDLFQENELPPVVELDVAASSQPWRVSKKYLFSCKDVLASSLLAHWGVEDDDEWASDADENSCQATQESSSEEEDPVDVKVKQWLEQSAHESVTEGTSTERTKRFY